MKGTYQPPRLEAAGSFAAVTRGRWGWGHDYFYRRFSGCWCDDGFGGGPGGAGYGGGFVAGGAVF